MSIHRYRYIGKPGTFLLNQTALGMMMKGKFVVQLEDKNHPWAYGWHESPAYYWVEL